MKLRSYVLELIAIVSAVSLFVVGIEYPSHATVLSEEIETILTEEGLVGVGWATVTPEAGIQTGASGYSDSSTQTPMSTQTRLHVGSIAKMVLATGVLKLVSDGQIDLDQPAENYFPDIAFNNPWRDTARVTVRHLLDHTSGLNDAQLWQLFGERAAHDTPLTEAFPTPDDLLRVRTRPGSRFSYSNSGYALLGMVIETVTGERYESWLDNNLLVPLGLLESTFEFTSQVGSHTDHTLSWGHTDDGSRYPAAPVFLRPAARFTTTTSDLARLAIFMMSDGSVNGAAFIRPDLMRSRGKPSGTDASEAGLVAGYALGLGRRDRNGVIGFCHGGNVAGFSAHFCVFPEARKAFMYSVNTDSETADYNKLQKALIKSIDPPSAIEPKTSNMPPDIQTWEGYYVLAPNRFETLAYLDTVFGFAKASREGEELLLDFFQGTDKRLRPTGEYMFSSHDRSTVSHALLKDRAGQSLITDGFRTYRKIGIGYLAGHWISMLSGLVGLLWIFAVGIISVLRNRRQSWRRPHMIAFAGTLGLLVPLPLFFLQPFMAFPDRTVASVSLVISCLFLFLTLIIALISAARTAGTATASGFSLLNVGAIVAALQWLVVLSVWGLMPVRMWAI